MIATTKIKMDLANLQRQPCVDVMQDDRYSRDLEISLFTGGVPFLLPQDAAVLLRCRKPDGLLVVYDTLPDGEAAWQISGNKVTVALAPQVCTAAGRGELTVSLLCGDRQLSSFTLLLRIHPLPRGVKESEKYIHVNGFLPQSTGAKVGQYLRVASAQDGKVTAVEGAFLSGGGGDAGAELPAYVTAEVDRLAQTVQLRQNEHTLTFLACSDPHYSDVHSHSAQMGEGLLHCAQAMNALRKRVRIDFTAQLGDLVWDSGETPRQAMGAMRYVNQLLTDGQLPEFHARGNHDCLYSSTQPLNDAQVFANVGIFNNGAVYDSANRLGGWCYRDFPDVKIRVVCINTCEASDGSFSVSQAQIDWLRAVLDLTTLGEGWGSVLLSHHPLDWYGSAQPVIAAVAAASGVLCAIHGHVHGYKMDTMVGTAIPRIAIPNICFYRNNEYGENGKAENSEGIEFGEPVTYDKTADSAEDTAFCVVTIDRGTGRLYADHYGAGYSRAAALDGCALESVPVGYTLDNVTTGTAPEQVSRGAAFVVRLKAAHGYTLGTVKVTMGGEDVTEEAYSAGTVGISCVTGEVRITASATASAAGGEDTGGEESGDTGTSVTGDLVRSSIDMDGSLYNGCGYRTDYRLSSDGSMKVLTGAISSGFIAYDGQNLCVGGSSAATVGTLGNYLVLYDVNFQFLNALGFDNLHSYGADWAAVDGKYALTIDPDALTNEAAKAQLMAAAYIRASLGKVAASDFYVTLSSGNASEDDDQTGMDSEPDTGEEPVTPYTNLVTDSIDSDGSVYNGCGYQADCRLNSSGGITALAGAIASGNIPYTAGQVVRICGAADSAVGYEGNYFGMYNAAFARINTIDFYNMVSYGAVWEQLGEKYMLTIDPAALTNEYVKDQLASAVYIRASLGTGNASDFIITLDQQIS